MAGEADEKDRDESRKIAIALVSLVVVLALAILLMLPTLWEITTVQLSPGLGIKDSAIISFFVTILLMIVFAASAGDGFVGEIQFMLGSFFLFFVIIWSLLAWIF